MPEGKVDRPLSPLLPRDCGHECRVCKVTVASLTDYASHISSPKHKQNVEDSECKGACSSLDDEYFDQALVELIEKRNERIRKEKEAAAAKLAQEEAEQKRREEFQQRLRDAKERFRCDWQKQPNPYGNQKGSWHKGNQIGTNPRDMQNGRPLHNSKWGKSATWHAHEPPNFSNFNRVKPPWISNAGSSNGVYGYNTISQNARPMALLGPSPPTLFPSLPKFLTKGVNQFQNQATIQGCTHKNGPKSADKLNPEAEHHMVNKSFGSNPKLDRTCRWSPYNVNKGSESMPNLVQKTPKSQKSEKMIESGASKPEKSSSSGTSSNNSSRSSSLQRDSQKSASTPSPSVQRAKNLAQQAERRPSLGAVVSNGSQASKTSENLKSRNNLSGLSKSDRQLPESVKKVKPLEKRRSLDSLSNIGQKGVEEQGQVGVNKENNIRQNEANQTIPALDKPAVIEKLLSLDQSHLHLHVSTSSIDSSACSILDQANEESTKSITKESPKEKLVLSTEESDVSKTSDPPSQSSQSLGISKLDLLPVLKRDLTKHMSSTKAKTVASLEPNLNIARRVRNLSGSKKSDTEKDSGLKPRVQQLISSSGSRRNVNWEQVYHEVRKKQDKGKGMPRFGIEMVPMDQEDHSQEEDDLPMLQGFHWESLVEAATPPTPTSRKRSLSESSIAPMPNPTTFFSDLLVKSEPQEISQSHYQDVDQVPELEMSRCEADDAQQEGQKTRQRADSVCLESSSGTEMCDGQGTAKKRRATREVPHPETSSLEHHTKRRKVKSKKERSDIEQLLAVSLREDELSRSLQSLDTDLINARAALEAAYAEVQRLMMTKQQLTTEMGTLRNQRIELLKGMKDRAELAPEISVKGDRLDEGDLHLSTTVRFITDPLRETSPGHSSLRASPPVQTTPRASPTGPGVPFTPVVIKEEPRSPFHVSSEQDTIVGAHSTTAELPTSSSAPDATVHSAPSLERRPDLCPRYLEFDKRDEFGEHIDSKESLTNLVQSMEKNLPQRSLTEPSSTDKILIPNWRDLEMGTLVESTGAPSFETPLVPSVFNVPTSPSEMRSGKKVRKLKKRKALKKAQGAELPESSDTEMDTEASRPKWIRNRRRNSGGSQVSTSNPQTEEREEDMRMEEEKEEPEPPKSTSEQGSVKSEPVKIDGAQGPSSPAQTPDSSKQEAEHVACHEVSSTSDMDISPAPESDVQMISMLPKMGKTSSDVSSDHGEDDLPTEGVFEGHVEAVNSMQIHNGLLYTCSGDRTVRAFDIVSHKCVATFEGHTSKVNSLLLSTSPSLNHRLYTGSSDQTIRCYSLVTQKFEEHFSLSDRVLCLHNRWKTLYAGLGNGSVVTFDLKTNRQTDMFECHGPRAVSCLASSQEGARRLLLVGSYDSTISVRDAKNGLLLRTLEGHSKTVLCMKVVNDLVFSGSSDQCVYAHNIHSGQLVRVYKGHSHAVSVVCVLGKVMVTACLDKLIRVYDLQTHEQLQVYGGHKDMVMCMTIHKNMIYTGCYDGSVQAVKLNLMQNYHCRWHGCSLVFGVWDHLEQHLSHDHSGPNLKTLRCRWKNCDEFFNARISSKQPRLLHMQKHAAEESQVEP